jgi:TolB-like protein/class 3 adenylate cyclase
MNATRKLVAILAADVAGYSRLMSIDEEGTHAQLKAHRGELIDPKIGEHRGRIVKTTGDGMLVEFASVVDAVRCAVDVQQRMGERNTDVSQEKRIELRVGINLGDIIIDGEDIYGDGVNIAARLEGMAEPGAVYVSGTAYDHVRDKLAYTFEDCGEQSMKNIARPVRVYRVRPEAPSVFASTPRPALALPDKPSIAVLPFTNLSGDPEQDYFADGMVEEIITALSRIKWLFVIARNSSFAYKGKAVDVKQVGRELGVRYVLEGSVRKVGDRVRITGQLIDALTGTHLWAEHFDGSLQDVFELQDTVAISVAGVIEPALLAAEIQRSQERPTADLAAYDLYLRATADAFSWERSGIIRALELVRQAIERDPRYGPALALAAMCHQNLHINGWSEDEQADRRQGVDLAHRALRVAGDDSDVLGTVALVLGYFEENIDPAIALIDHSLELTPSFASGWFWSGVLRLWAGQPELAIERFETSLRLNPRRRAPALLGMGSGHFFARRFDKAAALFLQSLQEIPSWVPTLRHLAACYAQMGRLDEAREIIKRIRAITPVVVPSAAQWRNAQQRELYLEGLRLATSDTS